MGADESDYYTTDLGEFIFVSLPTTAKYESWQTAELKQLGIGDVTAYDWTYRVDDLGFDDPYRCPPWMQGSTLNSVGLPCPEPKKQQHVYNEGWRFGVAYLVSAVFVALHGVVGKYTGTVHPIMDNGIVHMHSVREVEQVEVQV